MQTCSANGAYRRRVVRGPGFGTVAIGSVRCATELPAAASGGGGTGRTQVIGHESSKGGSVKSRRSKVITAVGIGLVAALGVAGCGAAEELSAKQRVSTALSGLNDATSAAFTVSVDTTAADLAALADA